MTHERGSEGGNWRMEWVASTLHTTSEQGVSSINTADAHTSAASSRLNWRPAHRADLSGLVSFARKTKSCFCACAITFQLAFTIPRLRNISEDSGPRLHRGGSTEITHDIAYLPLCENETVELTYVGASLCNSLSVDDGHCFGSWVCFRLQEEYKNYETYCVEFL